MICVLVGATIIHSNAIQVTTPESSPNVLAATINPDNNQPVVSLEKTASQKYQLNYLATPEGKLTVVIRDNSSRVIYRDVIFAEKFFTKDYDLSNLQLGDYQFEVMDEQSVKLMAEEIHVGAKSHKSGFDTKVELLDNERLAVFINSLDGVERTLKIFDEVGLIYEEEIDEVKFEKKFKFENVDSISKLTIQVSDSSGGVQYISTI